MLLPVERVAEFFAGLALPAPLDEAATSCSARSARASTSWCASASVT